MIGGPGVSLPYPTNPYPAQPAVPGVSSAVWTNALYMGAATLWLVPPGWWAIKCGAHSYVVYRDPVTQTLVPLCALGAYATVNSDGNNFYLFNASGTPVQIATITDAGTGYVAATTVVTPNNGGSTWQVVVDGSVDTITVGNDRFGNAGGTNFTIPPIVVVQAPPSPGVQCVALAALTSGAVSSITVETLFGNAGGAGYTQAPSVFLIPDPSDPNLGAITVPACTSALNTPVGAITAVLQIYHGLGESATTLAITGAGSSATATCAIVTASGADTNYVQWLGSGA
jgi:hypothetical protein